MPADTGDLQEIMLRVTEVQAQVAEAVARIHQLYPAQVASQSTITQNTASMPVWVAMTLCFGLFTATLTMVSVTTHHNDEARAQIRKDIDKLESKVSRLQDYVNVLYKQPTAKDKKP